MRFNLAHIIPDARLHGLYGYSEVIESIRWGLQQLGHEAVVRINEIIGDEVNIVFGFQMLEAAALRALPGKTIVYNLEQVASVGRENQRPATFIAAERVRIWDYSARNIAAWREFKPRFEPVHVPIGWAPVLERIPKRQVQDIDVLLYGAPSDNRLRTIAQLAWGCHSTVFACGLYGKARDELIARSKLVLNINRFEQTHVFEIVRVSYLLGNGKAVVSDVYPESEIDPDIRDAVALTPLETIPAMCNQLLNDASARQGLETLGPAVMRQRDVREILRTALRASGLEGD